MDEQEKYEAEMAEWRAGIVEWLKVVPQEERGFIISAAQTLPFEGE